MLPLMRKIEYMVQFKNEEINKIIGHKTNDMRRIVLHKTKKTFIFHQIDYWPFYQRFLKRVCLTGVPAANVGGASLDVIGVDVIVLVVSVEVVVSISYGQTISITMSYCSPLYVLVLL